MKICAKGIFGEFEWTLPHALVEEIETAHKKLPIELEDEGSRLLIRALTISISEYLLMECAATSAVLIGDGRLMEKVNKTLAQIALDFLNT